MGTSGQDIHSTGTSLISLSFIVGIKRSIKRSIGRRSRLCSGFWVSAGWVSINRFSLLMEHLSLDVWTRQTLRSRVRFLRISLTFSQLSEHQSQSVILTVRPTGTSNSQVLFKGASLSSHQSSLCRRVSVVIISHSGNLVWKGYSLDLGSRGWSHCQHLKYCWLVETPWGPILAAYPLSVHRPNRQNTPTGHPCVLHHLHLWVF